jgi:hypothetical protein
MESFMNGTVTLAVSPLGIEAEDFEGAKKKLKLRKGFKEVATITFEGQTLIEYKMASTCKIDPPPTIYGRMGATPLRII